MHTSHKSDNQLMKEVREGSQAAFEALFYRYHEKLYYFAMRYFNSKEDAEGIVQEIFLKVWTNRENLDERKSFNAFLHTMAKNAIFNINRKYKYETVYQNYARQMLSHVHTKSLDDVIYADLLKHLNEILDELPPKRRKIYELSRIEGLSYKEIAEKMNISEKTVETHIRLSLKTIKEALSKILVLLVLFQKI